MQQAPQPRVLIAGAGLGGLATAIGLRRAGIDDIAVFDRGHNWETIQVGGGMDLQMNAMRAFKYLGIHDEVQHHGTSLDKMVIKTPRNQFLAEWPYSELAKRFGVHDVRVTRDVLHKVLAEAVPEETVHFGKTVTKFSQDENGVSLHFADGSEERGDVLIGADGSNSAIRRQLFGNSDLRYAGYAFFRGMYPKPHSKVPQGMATMVLGWGAWFNMYPLEDKVSWFSCFRVPRTDEVNKEEILAHHREWLEPVEELVSGTALSAISRYNIVDRDPSDRWGEGRVTLIGDAAHAMCPTIAQGACQTVEDAVVLSFYLMQSKDVTGALRTYEAKRMARANSFVMRARKSGEMFVRESPVANWMRDRFLMSFGHRSVRNQFIEDMTFEF